MILRWLVLPMGLLLVLQWPLRDLVRAWSREANDLAQWLFALYVAAAVTAATRAGTHLATDAIARRYAEPTRRRLARAGALLALVPWALFVLATATPATWQSLRQLEAFPETGNPFYFVIKLATVLMAAMVAREALRWK